MASVYHLKTGSGISRGRGRTAFPPNRTQMISERRETTVTGPILKPNPLEEQQNREDQPIESLPRTFILHQSPLNWQIKLIGSGKYKICAHKRRKIL